MLAAFLAALALATPPQDRRVAIDGHALTLPASAEAAGRALRVELVVSSAERTLLATLVHRGWTPRDPSVRPLHPEVPWLVHRRRPGLPLGHPGARIDPPLPPALWEPPG